MCVRACMCVCVCVRVCVGVSLCVQRHVAILVGTCDEWLIMKLCMYVGYHEANNLSHFGGDPVTQLNFKNVKKN